MSGWIGVDLDGTLAEHYWPHKGAYDECRIGAPVPKMVERVKAWIEAGMEVRVFTARVGRHGSAPGLAPNTDVRNAITTWCLEHIGVALEATCEKDYMMIELWDDRAVRVICDTGERCCEESPNE